MSSFNYLLRNNSIVFNFQYGLNNRLRKCSTGYKVANTKNWLDSQKIKCVLAENNINEKNTPEQINKKLTDFKTNFQAEYNQLLEQGEHITNEILRDCAKRLLNGKGTIKKQKQLGFFEYFDLFVSDSETGKRRNHRNKQKISNGTIKTYGTTKTFLEDFVKYRNKPVYFSSINKEFYHELNTYTDETRQLSLNYKGKHIKVLKSFLEYVKNEYKVKLLNYNPKHFLVEKETVKEIALNIDELNKMYKVDLSHNELLDRARDLFLIGAFTGLRVSDFGMLTKDNIIRIDEVDCFQLLTEKTNTELLIPISVKVQQILDKHKGLPNSMLPQQINDNIKTVGELAKIDEEISITKTIGGKKVTSNNYKFELIKTHTARRSFCTNAYLNGVDSILIMSISGHTTESNFLNYIKVPPKEHAKRLAQHRFFKMM